MSATTKRPETPGEAIRQLLDKITAHIADLEANGKDAGFPWGNPDCPLCKFVNSKECYSCPLVTLFPPPWDCSSFGWCFDWRPRRFQKEFYALLRAFKDNRRTPRQELRWFTAAHNEIEAAAKKKGWL